MPNGARIGSALGGFHRGRLHLDDNLEPELKTYNRMKKKTS